MGRHSIESYLLEPEVLAVATSVDVGSIARWLAEEALDLRYLTAVNAAVAAYNRQHHRELVQVEGPSP